MNIARPVRAPDAILSITQRVHAVARLESLLEAGATRTNGFARAATLLKTDAFVCEPAGGGARGNGWMRVIAAPRHPVKLWFGIMPVFPPDARTSTIVRGMLEAKGDPAAALDSGAPILLVNMASRNLRSELPAIAAAINRRARSSG